MPSGWITEKVTILGNKRRAGGKHFRVGKRSLIRGVSLPHGDAAMLVVNGVGDVRVYGGMPGEAVDHHLTVKRGDGNDYRIGYSATGMPDYYQYAAALPNDAGTWDLLMADCRTATLNVARREANDALQFGPITPIGDMPRTIEGYCPVIDVVDWRRDGSYDLLLAHADGSITRRAQLTGEDEPVVAGDAPVDFAGPLFISVVDIAGCGRSDLLVGTGDGYVMLLRDVGDDEVRYDRGRRLRDSKGFVQVKGPACPTVVDGKLLVGDDDGCVWSWPINQVNSFVTTDDFAAFGISREAYAESQWWLRRDDVGVVLAAGPEPPRPPREKGQRTVVYDPPAPPLVIQPPTDGPCEVHVTFRKPDDVHEEMVAEICLDDGLPPMVLRGNEFDTRARQEVFFKAADLTDRTITVTQQTGALTSKGGLPVYIEKIRVVPLKAMPAHKPRRKALPVSGIFDAVMYTLEVKCDTPALIDQLMAMHREAGFDWMYYKLGGGTWEYPSNVPGARSVVPTDDTPGLATMTEADRVFCQERIDIQESINWIELGAKACHKQGMKFFGWHRVQNHGERLHGKGPLDQFYVDNPQFLEKNIEGKPTPGKLCLGYPEVRQYQTAICEEAIDLGADGIMMETLRHLPKAMCGDPIVELFEKRYGEDMRKLPAFDERVVAVQNEVFTTFLREVKEAICAKKPDAELHVRVCKADALLGCDPRAWAKEGIVDHIIIEHRAPKPAAPDIAGLVAACKDTKTTAGAVFARTKWAGQPMPLHPYRIEREVRDYVAAGASSISFYETARVIDRPEYSRAIRRINDAGWLPSVML